MQFVNRMFLSWYGPDTLAACVPAGMLSFTFSTFFVGMAAYTTVFVAQYYGARRLAHLSSALWQGVWLALASGVIIAAMLPVGIYFINTSGHAAAVKELEREYFSILILFGWVMPLTNALSAFYTGQGRSKVTMRVNIAGNAVNILLSWLLIFGFWKVPAMGIKGAAWALVFGNLTMAALYFSLILSPKNRRKYRTAKLYGFCPDIFKRLLKYGAPSGFGFFLDIASFTVFVFIVGATGTVTLAANNIVLALNMLVFMPLLGVGMATSTLVGQYLGRKDKDTATKVVYSAAKMALAYAVALGALFFFLPQFCVNIFGSPGDPRFQAVSQVAVPLMRILAFFIFFDAMCIVFGDAIRGGGDTRFHMSASILCAWVLFVPGTWLLVYKLHSDMQLIWLWQTFYVFVLVSIFYFRFRSGKWREHNLIS